MRWLKVLSGTDKPPVSDTPVGLTGETDDARYQVEPFSYVSNGLEAWEAGDHERAERLLKQGVQAYRLDEPDSVDFALGCLGAFLLDRARVDEAAAVLEEAITWGTDIPAIWADYLDFVTTPPVPFTSKLQPEDLKLNTKVLDLVKYGIPDLTVHRTSS